jgi:hypothetical protein
MKAPPPEALALALLVAHWFAEFAPLPEKVKHVLRLIVLSVETLWTVWRHRKQTKRQRPTDHSAQE